MSGILSNILLAVIVVALVVSAAHAQTFSLLYDFGNVSGDPEQPYLSGIVAQGRDGNLYTTSAVGGANGVGCVFNITPGGNLTVLSNFGAIGAFMASGLTLGTDGNLYGGSFKITPKGTLTPYSFAGSNDAPPIQGTGGNFYGTTTGGGSGYGTVYKLTQSGTQTTLYVFDSTHGANPYAPLVQGTDGNLYGTTALGGANNYGTVFKLSTSGKFTLLYSFDGVHGQNPYSPLTQGADGYLYGTTSKGGSGNGVVFKISSSGVMTTLHSFDYLADGGFPYGGLIQASDGNFYGQASQGGSRGYGTIYEISPAGAFAVLYLFDRTTGQFPTVTLTQHTNGLLYGDATGGGSSTQCGNDGCGTFYSLNAGLPPFIRLLPIQGRVGNAVEILGQGFTGTTSVSFNGTAAKFKAMSDTYLIATVPRGASTGAVSVSTPGGTLTSNQNFRVAPTITSFSPASGPAGTPIVITGVSLTQTTKITIGGVLATNFSVNSDTQVTATVPTKAKTGKIMITTAGGMATSGATFTVTP